MSAADGLVRVLETIRSRHLALPPATPEELERLRSRSVPADLVDFYSRTNGAGLHREEKYGALREMAGAWWHWVVVPLCEMKTIQEIGYIQPESPHYDRSKHWLGLVNVQDGNYLALSLEPGHAGEVIDCFHETVGAPGYSSIIALSFTELMEQLVRSREAFWLQEGHRGYGVY